MTGNIEFHNWIKETMMMKKKAFYLSTFVLAVLLLLSSPASADTLNLVLTNALQTGTAGSTFSFEATVSAPGGNTGTIFLNGDSFNLDSPLVLDDSGFFGFPLSLDPGDSFTGTLFTVGVPSGTLPGLDSGFLTIQGGPDGGTLDDLSTAGFQVNVAGPSAVPEPGSALLFATGLVGIAVALRKKEIRV